MVLPPSWKGDVQKAVEEAVNTEADQRQAEQNDAAAKIAAAIKALGDAQNTQTAHEDRNEKINVTLAVITIFLVFLTVVFTGASWWVFSGQLEEMKSAGTQTKQLIDANAKLAEAANKQASAAAENAKTAHDSYIASQRAWVGPTNAKIDGEIAVSKPLSIVIDYLNTGREPALNFMVTANAFVSSTDEESRGVTMARVNADFKGCRDAQVNSGGTVVFPSTGGITPSGQSLTISKPDTFIDQDIIDGNNTIVVDGCFLYKSIGITRHSYFCYFYRSKLSKVANLSICINGNGAD